MLKIEMLTVLAVLFFSAQTSTIRFLQFNDTLCAKWNSDGTTCLQCAYRAYYDVNTGKCTEVNNQCQTWDLANGDCITCYEGYGDAPTNGKAINGQCPIYNSSNVPMDPNCKIFITRSDC